MFRLIARISQSSSALLAPSPVIAAHFELIESMMRCKKTVLSKTFMFKGYHSTAHPGHVRGVNFVCWSSSGERLASASADMSVRLWSVRGGTLTSVAELQGHKKAVIQLAWEPGKDTLLASCSSDKTVRLWDVRSAKCAAEVPTKGENINIAYTRDGSMVVVGSKKDELSWIDTRTRKVVHERNFPYETNEFAYTPDGAFFVACTGRGSVDAYAGSVLDGSFKKVSSLPAHAGSCYSLSFAPNGSLFAVGAADALVTLWDAGEMLCYKTIARSKAAVRAVSFSHTSQVLASGGEDGNIDLASSADGSQLHVVKAQAPVNSVAWNPTALVLAYVVEPRSGGAGVGSVFLFSPP